MHIHKMYIKLKSKHVVNFLPLIHFHRKIFTKKPENLDIYLFHFGQVQRVFVVGPELHESHVGRLRQLRDALNARKKPAIKNRESSLRCKCGKPLPDLNRLFSGGENEIKFS